MNLIQKQILFEKAKNFSEDAVRLLSKMFDVFEKYGIEYEMLTIPMTDLNLEKFIEPDQISSYLKDVDLSTYIKESRGFHFDIYIPSLKWVFNTTHIPVRAEATLENLVENTFAHQFEEFKDWAQSSIEPAATGWDVKLMIKKALAFKLREMGLSHPYQLNQRIVADYHSAEIVFSESGLEFLDGWLCSTIR